MFNNKARRDMITAKGWNLEVLLTILFYQHHENNLKKDIHDVHKY